MDEKVKADVLYKNRDKLISDCFGNVAGHKHCTVLLEDICLSRKCPFYKTRKEYEAGMRGK